MASDSRYYWERQLFTIMFHIQLAKNSYAHKQRLQPYYQLQNLDMSYLTAIYCYRGCECGGKKCGNTIDSSNSQADANTYAVTMLVNTDDTLSRWLRLMNAYGFANIYEALKEAGGGRKHDDG